MIKIGIVGLANVGKSSLFKALTKKPVEISNYPFCTIDPNVGIVQIPDQRLPKIAEIFGSKKITPSAIEFIDIAGLVKNSHKGEGLGNQFLHHIRETDAVLEVVRAFKNEDILHTEKTVDPIRDIEIVKTEFALKDLETIEKNLQKLKKELKAGEKKNKEKIENLESLKNQSEKGRFQNSFSEKELTVAKEIQLLSTKPVLFAINGSLSESEIPASINPAIAINIKEELDFSDLAEEEKIELGFKSKINELIEKSCETLNLITFYTANKNEARATAMPKNSSVLKAAEMIHNDFKEKFIKANVINYNALAKAGSWQKAKEQGLIGTEGKEYIVEDADIIEFRI